MDDENVEPKIRTLQDAAHDRDEGRGSPWDALAKGELSVEEEAALRAEAERTEEGRTRVELYRPLDDGARQRIAERLQELLNDEAPPRSASQPVVKLRPRHPLLSRLTMSLSGMGVAAGIALLYVFRAPTVEVALSESLGPGVEARATRLDAPDAELRLTVVPVRPIEGTLVVLRALLEHDGQTIPWDPRPNPTSPDNKIRIVGARRALFPCLPSGEWRILVAVGVAGEAPSEREMVEHAGGASAGAYQVLSKRVWLGAPVSSDASPCPR